MIICVAARGEEDWNFLLISSSNIWAGESCRKLLQTLLQLFFFFFSVLLWSRYLSGLWTGASVSGAPITTGVFTLKPTFSLPPLFWREPGCCSGLVDLFLCVCKALHKFIITLSLFVVVFFCLLTTSVLARRRLRRQKRWLSLLRIVPKRRKSFHQSDDFDNLLWTETKESEQEVLRIFIYDVHWSKNSKLSHAVQNQQKILSDELSFIFFLVCSVLMTSV